MCKFIRICDDAIELITIYLFKCSDETPDAISLRVGSPSFLNGGSIVHVKRLIPNDKYNSTLHDYDFGLIETNEDFKYTEYIQAIALPSADDNNATDGAVCAVYSWGKKTIVFLKLILIFNKILLIHYRQHRNDKGKFMHRFIS